MKIDYLFVRSRFKNLENTRIDFDEENLMTVIVGSNGSGKSNILELLVGIFRNLDLGESPPCSYVIRYKLGENEEERWITVDADPKKDTISDQYSITVSKKLTENKSTPVSISRVKRDKKGNSDYLPKYLFAYYSGPSDRLERYFRKHRSDFYRKLLKSQIDLKGDIRPLFYAKPYHSQFVLLAFFLSEQNDNERKFLYDELGIEDLDSVHFVMRRPEWAKTKDELFWGASGVVRDFLDTLIPHVLAPLKITRPEDLSLTGNNIKNEFFHLYLPSVSVLREFAQGLSPDIFFKMLESTLLSEIISEVSVRVKVRSSTEPLSFAELSEGEQQLLTVLGLLKFTGGKDSLFLLDEPDTHLNPSWAVKYLKFLRAFVPNHRTSHLLMVTHHPLAIAELEKGQVQVMWQDENTHQVFAQAPAESPRGMGYGGILTSDMFGLRSTLDNPTEELLRERRRLIELDSSDENTITQLKALDEKIEALGFTTSHWDADYQEYLRAKKIVESDEAIEDKASPVVQSLRHQRALQIVKRLVKEKAERDQ